MDIAQSEDLRMGMNGKSSSMPTYIATPYSLPKVGSLNAIGPGCKRLSRADLGLEDFI